MALFRRREALDEAEDAIQAYEIGPVEGVGDDDDDLEDDFEEDFEDEEDEAA